MDSSIASVIPARGGSKGIPRKNLRILEGEPLIGHSIKKSLGSDFIDSVVVTTEDPEIVKVAEKYDIDEVIERPDRLSEDDVPLSPVIEHAADNAGGEFDYILCFQPTVPLIETDSLDRGIEKGVKEECDSVIYVRDSTHNYWREAEEGFVPLSEGRKNRQQMDRIYEEIGVFLTDINVVKEGERIGEFPVFHSVGNAEGNDIDDYTDWVQAKEWLNRDSLVYRVTGNKETGMGHVYRAISLALHCTEHEITFTVSEEDILAMEMLERNNLQYEIISSDESFVEYVDRKQTDIVVNDVLETDPSYIKELKRKNVRVVNIEDLSDGSDHADAVINALYEFSNPPENHYYGHRYFCLRNEFRYSTPLTSIEEVNRILVSFGGVDPNDQTSKTLSALNDIDSSFTVDVILGPGYKHLDRLKTEVSEVPDSNEVNIHQDVSFMSDYMEKADLLVTSNGRTVYEATALNLPTVSIAQNQREQQHPFVHVTKGILNLGLAEYVSEEDIRHAINDYVTNRDMRDRMQSDLADRNIKDGIDRVKSIIFE